MVVFSLDYYRLNIQFHPMSENELATIALDICFEIHKEYGPGLYESVYEELFCSKLSECRIEFLRQQAVPLIHNDIKLEIGFRADIIIEGKLIIEIKSVEVLADIHWKQVLTYLKLSNIKLGLLVNFNVPQLKDGIKRIVNKL
jgi:GxxExxY protein